MRVSLVARREGLAASLLLQWRELERQGALTAVSAGEAVVPASELVAARAEIAKLRRVLDALLLPKAPRRRQSNQPHEGKVAVAHRDMRWCSDRFEIKCDSGQAVTVTFTQDCCDWEIFAYRAWEGKGCRAKLCARCSSRPWRNASAKSRLPRLTPRSSSRTTGRLHRGRDTEDCQTARSEAGQHARMQPSEQWHGRELREHVKKTRLHPP